MSYDTPRIWFQRKRAALTPQLLSKMSVTERDVVLMGMSDEERSALLAAMDRHVALTKVRR